MERFRLNHMPQLYWLGTPINVIYSLVPFLVSVDRAHTCRRERARETERMKKRKNHGISIDLYVTHATFRKSKLTIYTKKYKRFEIMIKLRYLK